MEKKKLAFDFLLLIVSVLGYGVSAVTNFERKSFLLQYPGDVISIEEGRKREEPYPKSFGSFIYFTENLKYRKELQQIILSE